VANHHPNLGFGVRFIGLTEQEQKALAQMLSGGTQGPRLGGVCGAYRKLIV